MHLFYHGYTLLKVTDYCGVASGKRENKFEATGLTPINALKVKAPLIKECPVNLECEVKNVVSLGTHDLFMAEIVAVHADEEVLDSNERVMIEKAQPIAFCYNFYNTGALKVQ